MKKICLLFLSLLFILSGCQSDHETDRLIIDILEIGKADCIIIRYNRNTTVIDTGEAENLPTVLAYFQKERIDTVDTLILSHFDKDHIGGAEELLKNLKVKQVIESTFSSTREEYDRYHKMIQEKNIPLYQITEAKIVTNDSFSFTVLPPKKNSYEKKEDNNASLIVDFAFGQQRFLFCGDAMELRLKEFISENKSQYDFVKIPYHGNQLDCFSEFLTSVRCSYAAICNSHKNPSAEETQTLLRQFNVDFYETKNGQIRLTSDGKTIKMEQF